LGFFLKGKIKQKPESKLFNQDLILPKELFDFDFSRNQERNI
jgi:hypothetical protein